MTIALDTALRAMCAGSTLIGLPPPRHPQPPWSRCSRERTVRSRGGAYLANHALVAFPRSAGNTACRSSEVAPEPLLPAVSQQALISVGIDCVTLRWP